MNKLAIGKFTWWDITGILTLWVIASIYLSGCSCSVRVCDKYDHDVQAYFTCVKGTR